MLNLTYNFKEKEDLYLPGRYVHESMLKDKRNGISCMRPTLDIECYINYINLLNSVRNKWQSYGYLDYGMLPWFMPPSFMLVPEIKLQFLSAAQRLGVRCYEMPAVSLLYNNTIIAEKDLWVFRKDVADALGLDYKKVTTEEIFRRLGLYE